MGLPPQLELLADSVTSQVHDNLFKLAHTESIGMHIASLMQGHTGTNRLCNYSFYPLLIRSCTKQSCYSYLATLCVSCLKTETQSEGIDTHMHTCTHTNTHTHSPEGHGSRCLAEAEKDSFEYQQRATGDNCS